MKLCLRWFIHALTIQRAEEKRMITIRQRRKLQHVQVAVAVSKANSCIVCVHVSSVLVGDQARQLFLGVEEGGGRRKGMPEG